MSTTYEGVAQRGTPPVTRHNDIACRDAKPEVFFPPPGGSPMDALAICASCNHRQECADWAVDTRQRFGIWGATTPAERERMIERGEAS